MNALVVGRGSNGRDGDLRLELTVIGLMLLDDTARAPLRRRRRLSRQRRLALGGPWGHTTIVNGEQMSRAILLPPCW